MGKFRDQVLELLDNGGPEPDDTIIQVLRDQQEDSDCLDALWYLADLDYRDYVGIYEWVEKAYNRQHETALLSADAERMHPGAAKIAKFVNSRLNPSVPWEDQAANVKIRLILQALLAKEAEWNVSGSSTD